MPHFAELATAAGTKNRLRLLGLETVVRKGELMKIAVAVLGAILFAGPLSHLAYAQAQIGVPGLGQVTIGQPPPPSPPNYGQAPPGYGEAPPPYDRRAEHCEHLRYREHELRQQVAYMPYGQERARAEEELRYVHEARKQCWQH
jgi:hypothetical protein